MTTAVLGIAVLSLVGVQIFLAVWVHRQQKEIERLRDVERAVAQRDQVIARLEAQLEREHNARNILEDRFAERMDEIVALGDDDPGSLSRALRSEFDRLRAMATEMSDVSAPSPRESGGETGSVHGGDSSRDP